MLFTFFKWVFSNKFPYVSLASFELVAVLLPLPPRSDLSDINGSPLLLIFCNVYKALCCQAATLCWSVNRYSCDTKSVGIARFLSFHPAVSFVGAGSPPASLPPHPIRKKTNDLGWVVLV